MSRILLLLCLLITIFFRDGYGQDLFEDYESAKNLCLKMLKKDLNEVDSLLTKMNQQYELIKLRYPNKAPQIYLDISGIKCNRILASPDIQLDSLKPLLDNYMVHATHYEDLSHLAKAHQLYCHYYLRVGQQDKARRNINISLNSSLENNIYDVAATGINPHYSFLTADTAYKKKIVPKYESLIDKVSQQSKEILCIHLSRLEMEFSNYDKSYYYLEMIYDSVSLRSDTTMLAHINYLLSDLYLRRGQYTSALSTTKKTITLINAQGEYGIYALGLAYTLRSLAFNRLNEPDSALYYARLGYKTTLHQENRDGMVFSAGVLGELLNNLGKHRESLNLAFWIIKNYERDKGGNFPSIYQLVVEAYVSLGRHSEALPYANMTLDFFKLKKSDSQLAHWNGKLSDIYSSLKKHEQSMYHKNKQLYYLEKTWKKHSDIKLATVEAQFQVKTHEYENVLLQKRAEKSEILSQKYLVENEKNTQLIQKDKRIKKFLIGSFVFAGLLLSSLLVIFIGRNRIKKQQLVLKDMALEKQVLNAQVLKEKLGTVREKLALESKAYHELKEQIELAPAKIKNSEYLKERVKSDTNWLVFMNDFNLQYNGVVDKLKVHHPDLTNLDLRIVALIKLNTTNKEVEHLLAITNSGVKKAKVRVRVKLGLEDAPQISGFIDRFIEKHC